MTGPLLCAVADVRRLTGVTLAQADDDALTSTIESTSDWFIRISGRSFADEGTSTFYNARLDDLFTIPASDVEVTEVRMVTIPALDPFTFTDADSDFQVINGNQVQLYMFAPYFQAMTYGIDNWTDRTKFARIEVDWTTESDAVPPAVRDGIALCAGALTLRGRTESSNKTSEKIGDYAFTLNDTTDLKVLSPMAYTMLRPFMRRSRVVVT